MAKYSAVKATVNAYIKQNGRKEITGRILNAVLNATIDSLGKYFQFAGGALPTDDPGTPDQNVCYLAGEPGVYTNFGGITIENEEVALLFWNGEWTKQRILIGIREVNASVDNQVGTPSVDVSYSGGELVLTFHNLKGEQGETGDPAGFGTIGADINGGVGTPGVSVETSGDNTAKNLMFHFTNLKGETGVTSVVATIDNTSGTPSCQVSLVNGVLTLAFSGLKGLKGDTGVSADYPITIYNGLDSDATDQALAAAQGKVLDGKVSQLGQEVLYKTDKKGGKNLLDISVVTRNKYFNAAGTIVDSTNYSISGYIPVDASTTYCYSRKGGNTSPGGSQYFCFYDSSKTLITPVSALSGLTFTTPATAAYVRVPIYNNYITDSNELMVEKGSARSGFKLFNPIGGYPINEDAAISLENKVDIKAGKNLFNIAEVVSGVISANGVISSSTTYSASGYMPVTEGQQYSFTRKSSASVPSGSNYVAYYSADKGLISSEILQSTVLTIPTGAAFARVSIYNNYLSDDIQFEAGTTRTEYQTYSPIGGYSSGPADISGSLVQTTGNATDKAMSQKATTDAINSAIAGLDVSSVINRMKYAQVVGDENKLYVQKDFSLDSTNWTTTRAIVANENGKLKITCDTVYSYHIAWLDFTQNPLNLSYSQFGIDLDVIEGTQGNTDYYKEIDEIDILLCSEDTKRTDENAYSTLDAYPIVVNAAYTLYPGAYKTNAPLSLARNGVEHTVDLTGIKWVAIRIKTIQHSEAGRTNYDGTPSIVISRLFTFAKPKRKQVIFGFDGGYTGQIDAGNYLLTKGLTGTFFVTRYQIGTPGHITSTQLHTLKNGGHLVAMYSAPSPWKGWYDMSLAEKEAVIIDQAEWLYENGFGDGALYASVPGGGYSEDEVSLFTSGKIKMLTGRPLYNRYNIPCGYYGPFSTGHSCGPAVPTSARKDAIDALINDGGFCIFIFHQCTGQSDDITLADFQEIVDYVAEKRDAGLLEVVTANDFKTYELSNAPQSE